MSLWKVHDKATRELMEAYYDGLLASGGRSEATRPAQLGMLNNPDRASPYFWASSSLAFCRRLVRRVGHQAYSAEVTEQRPRITS